MSKTKKAPTPAPSGTQGSNEPNEQVEQKEQAQEEKEPSAKEQWEAKMAKGRLEQGLPEGATPEDRESRYADKNPDSAVVTKLREAGDPRGGQLPAHGFEEYERAASDEQKAKSAEMSASTNRFFNGTKAWIYNPGAPDHGRAIGINRVSEYESEMDEMLDSVQGGRGKVKSYECTSRDGRAELLIVSHEHIRPAHNEAEWGKTPLMTPIPNEA